MNTENKCIFVSSRGILNACDIKSLNPSSSISTLKQYNMNSDNIKTFEDGTTIYVCTSAVRTFIQTLFNKINFKFILVTGDCDYNCYTDILSETDFNIFINNPRMIHWFSQNCVSTHDKLTKIPIGLDYHTISTNKIPYWGPQMTPLEQEKELIELRKQMKPFFERQITAYSNFHFQIHTRYGDDRVDAIKSIPTTLMYYEPLQTTRTNSWKTQLQHAFVVSPHGGGYDCHRTWEALLLGCIPIMRTSPIDALFEDLPVLIVKEWKHVTEELLKETILSYQEKMHTFNFDKLLLSYWTNLFKSKTTLEIFIK
jgi:hypothetical protein